MYRLKIIAGPKNSQPAVGASFELKEGELSIGRHSQNEIVLASGNVSKKHLMLIVDHGKVLLQDNGSANGTFVNGQLTSRKQLSAGDKISVGEYVIEFKGKERTSKPRASSHSSSAPGQVIAFPGSSSSLPSVPTGLTNGIGMYTGGAAPAYSSQPLPDASTPVEMPEATSLPGRLKNLLEYKVLPYFFELNSKHELRMMGVSLVGAFLALSSLIGVYPLIDAHEDQLRRELTRKAKLIAFEVADRNSAVMISRQDSKTDVGNYVKSIENGIKGVFLVDLNQKIVAPAEHAGQLFASGEEGSFLTVARAAYSKADISEGVAKMLSDGGIMAIHPVRAFSSQAAKNITVGFAVTIIDGSVVSMSAGEVSMLYGYAMVIAALVGAFFFYILYRLTLRPLSELNTKVDQALRGEMVDFRFSGKFEEMDEVWTVIDSALRRLPRSDSLEGMGSGLSGMQSSDLIPTLTSLAHTSANAMAVFEENRAFSMVNPAFEEVTSIRGDSCIGQTIQYASGDQAFTQLVDDLMSRAMAGGAGISETLDFSGTTYKVTLLAFGANGGVKAYLMTLTKDEAFG